MLYRCVTPCVTPGPPSTAHPTAHYLRTTPSSTATIYSITTIPNPVRQQFHSCQSLRNNPLSYWSVTGTLPSPCDRWRAAEGSKATPWSSDLGPGRAEWQQLPQHHRTPRLSGLPPPDGASLSQHQADHSQREQRMQRSPLPRAVLTTPTTEPRHRATEL